MRATTVFQSQGGIARGQRQSYLRRRTLLIWVSFCVSFALSMVLRPSCGAARDLTKFTDFRNLCIAFAETPVGDVASSGHMRFVSEIGGCQDVSSAMKFGVTQENDQNTHLNSANYAPGVHPYLADYNRIKDFGRWLSLGVDNHAGMKAVKITLDTIKYDEINSVTGWPIRYGHLFVGLSDAINAPLKTGIKLDLDVVLLKADVDSLAWKGYSGQRLILGVVIDWQEAPPRKNRSHFFELDLMQARGYSASYHEADRQFCHDRSYDRCFYDAQGQYAEGREIPYPWPASKPLVLEKSNAISVDLFSAITGLGWVSPPENWGEAIVKGIYFGLESEGATNTSYEVRSYRVYSQGSPPILRGSQK